MTKDDKDVEVQNPLYAGATPGMVVRALARPVKDAKREDAQKGEPEGGS